MQLIGEAYALLKGVLGLSADEMGTTFREWNTGRLDSYLIEITGTILRVKDEDGLPLVDKILDVAGQKGTGRWTAIAALDEGVPLTLIGEAVFARSLSALKDERVAASRTLTGPDAPAAPDRAAFVRDLEAALYAAKIVSYAQGYMLMRSAAKTYGWRLNYGGVAQMWRGGCIIRSAFLDDIKNAYADDENLANLMLAPFFRDALLEAQAAWRRVVATAVAWGVPVPAFGAALALWFAPSEMFLFVVATALAGAVVTIATVVWHSAGRRLGPAKIPYGLAIAAGAVVILAQRYLNHFA